MRVKLLTFRYSATLGGFDDTALVDFTRDKEVIAFREHFYAVNETPHLTCIVHYQDAVVPQAALEYARQAAPSASSSPAAARAAPPTFRRRDGRPDPCAGLDEAGRALFNHFREWRSKQAHDDGVPPYLVLTDKQVLELLRRRPDSPTALGHIEGIGPGKIERYGAAILRCLHGHAPSAPPPEVVAAPAEPTTAEVAP